MGAHLVVEPVGHLLAGGDVGAAGIRRDREAGGNRNAQGRHLGQADALSAQELTAPGGLLVEVEDIAHGVILAQTRTR